MTKEKCLEKSVIIKSNKLIEAGYRLTVIEQKLVTKLISMIKYGDISFKEHTFKLSSLIQEFNMNKFSGYRDILNTKISLQKKLIIINRGTSDEIVTPFLTIVGNRHAGYINFCLNSELKPYLLNLTENYTMYKVKDVFYFKSAFSFRLYELLKQYMYTKKEQRILTLKEIRFYLGIGDKVLYGNIKVLLNSIQKELSEKSDIAFTYKEIKRGKQVISLLFKTKKVRHIIKSKGKTFIVPSHEFSNPSVLRNAIHKVYGGKCQYCDKPDSLPIENTIVEHIISRSIPIESIIDNLRQEGFSEDSINSFRNLLPPCHNSVLNLTLACYRHNRIKNDSIINPVSMELLLRRSERKAIIILKHYQNLESSEGTSNNLNLM